MSLHPHDLLRAAMMEAAAREREATISMGWMPRKKAVGTYKGGKVRERCEDILQMLRENDGLMKSRDMELRLGVSQEQFKKSARLLTNEGRIERHHEGWVRLVK